MTRPLIAAQDLLSKVDEAILLDCRPRTSYDKGHLSGAFHASLKNHLSRAGEAGLDPARGGRHPLPDAPVFCAQLGRWGIELDSWVVCYDDQGASRRSRHSGTRQFGSSLVPFRLRRFCGLGAGSGHTQNRCGVLPSGRTQSSLRPVFQAPKARSMTAWCEAPGHEAIPSKGLKARPIAGHLSELCPPALECHRCNGVAAGRPPAAVKKSARLPPAFTC
jgi:hypothetical protein